MLNKYFWEGVVVPMCLDFRIRMFRIIVITLLICISMLPDVFAEKYESPSNLVLIHVVSNLLTDNS